MIIDWSLLIFDGLAPAALHPHQHSEITIHHSSIKRQPSPARWVKFTQVSAHIGQGRIGFRPLLQLGGVLLSWRC
jgi:hypothetical protein